MPPKKNRDDRHPAGDVLQESLGLPTASTSPTLGEVHPKVSPTPKGFTSTVLFLGPMARTIWGFKLLIVGVAGVDFLKQKNEGIKKKTHLPFFNTPSKNLDYLFVFLIQFKRQYLFRL